MKKIAMMIVALAMTVAAQAQYYGYKTTPFHQDKYFIGASVSGLDLHYNSVDDFTLGLNATAGYFVFDNWLVLGNVGFNTNGPADDSFSFGGGARYYIEQNGLYLGANLNYVHAYKGCNDLMPGVEVGYAFFLSRTVTVEPAIYYNISTKDFSDRSTVGLKIGFGIYLND
ncbi:MAG: hypothetical protein J5506_05560 [Prevotella sp.]|nr:hypothetical protein [Prevotella sp.]